MREKPKLDDLLAAKKILKRWYFAAKNRNKESAMYETKKIYDLLEYFEENFDFRIK